VPTHQKTSSVELSGRLLDKLEQYAQAHGITTDEAASRLVSQSFRTRYVRKPQQPAQVLPLRRPR
jgi:hypothetical protein